MTEVVSPRFQAMKGELEGAIEQAIQEYALRHGRPLNLDEVRGQSGLSAGELAEQVLMHGMNVWTDDSEDVSGVDAENVVVFPSPTTRRRSRFGAVAKVGASSMGAIVGSTLLAAAVTDSVGFPGLSSVASTVYIHNPPAEEIRYLEIDGRFMRIRAVRRAGEPGDVIHLVSALPTTERVALDVEADPMDDPILEASANADLHVERKVARVTAQTATATLDKKGGALAITAFGYYR